MAGRMNWNRVEKEKRIWGGKKREDPDHTTSIVQNDTATSDGAFVTTPPVPAKHKRLRPSRRTTVPPSPKKDATQIDVPTTCSACGERIPERYAAWHRDKKCRTACADCGEIINTRALYDHRDTSCAKREPGNVGVVARARPRRRGVKRVCPHCMRLISAKQYSNHQTTCRNQRAKRNE